MRRFSGYLLLTACCASALTGCSSTSWFSNPFAKDSAQPTQISTAAPPGPSTFEKINESVASVPRAIGNSIVGGARTIGHWVVPDHSSDPVASAAAASSAPISADAPKVGPELYVASARLYERNGNMIGAADQYQKALKIAPDNLVAQLSYAHLMDRQNKLDQATQLYNRAVKSHPHEAAAFNDLGLCYARRRMLSESAASLSQAVQLQPDRELYRNNLATVLIEQNRPEEALKQLQAVQADAVAHYNIAYLLQQRGHDQLALSYVNQAAQIDPSFTEARDWSMRLTSRVQGAPGNGATMASLAAAPNDNSHLVGSRYSGQQTSAYYQPGQMSAQAAVSDYQSADLRALPPVQ